MLKYKGFYKAANRKPKGEWIQIFASDWFKQYWAFYAYVSLENYEEDIDKVNDLIHRLNWRDGDVYVELIDHSPELKDFYHHLYERGYFTHHNALNPQNWRNFLAKQNKVR
jgi:hypothetical protein